MLIKSHLQPVYYGIQTCSTDVMELHLDTVRSLMEHQPISADHGIYLRLCRLLQLMRGNYNESRNLLRKSIEVFQQLDPDINGQYAINIAGVYNYMAECFRLECNYDEAFHYYDQAIIYNCSRGYYP